MDPLEANTSANIRNRGLISALVKCGHIVNTLSLEPDRDSICFDKTMENISRILNERLFFQPHKLYKLLRTKKSAAISTEYEPKFLRNKTKNKIKKALKTIVCYFSIYDIQKINVGSINKVTLGNMNPDIIISSSDPKSAHLVAAQIIVNEKLQCRWIQYWGDPMLMDITTHYGTIKGILVKSTEKSLLRQADKIVYTSPLTWKIQQKLFPIYSSKFHYSVQIPLPITAEGNSGIQHFPSIGYFGNYASNIRNIVPLCEAVAETKYPLVIVGDGDSTFPNCDNISLYKRVSYGEAQQMESNTNIVVVLCNKKGTQIPGKIYYVAGCQKPIILILDGEYQEYLTDFFGGFDRYILCQNNKDSILNAIRQACQDLDSKKQFYLPKKMQPSYIANKIIE